MLKNDTIHEEVRIGFATLQAYVELGQPTNLLDGNNHIEDFIGELLNIVYGWNLASANTKVPNAECIDLIDNIAGLAIQVTGDTSGPKIKKTLRCMNDHGLSKKVSSLKIFVSGKKQDKYQISENCPGISFDPKEDILSFEDVLKILKTEKSLVLEDVHTFVTRSIPRLYESVHHMIIKQRDEVTTARKLFYRELLVAPCQYEDPTLMCKAIRDIRIELQKIGVQQHINTVARESFAKAHKILQTKEYEIRDKYPYIYDEAVKLSSPVPPPTGYRGDDWTTSIHCMMDIRKPLEQQLVIIDAEVERLNGLLSR